MPVRAQKRGARWRIVEGDPPHIAKGPSGSPLDGGGHSSKAKADRQARAVNASLARRGRIDAVVRQRWPRHVEARYRRYLRRRVQALSKLVRTQVLPAVQPEGGGTAVHGVAKVRTDALSWTTLLALLDTSFAQANPPPEQLLRGMVSQVDESVTSPLLALGIVPVPTEPRALEWFEENARLIKSIDRQFLDDVGLLLQAAEAEGWGQRQLARELSKRTGVALSRAKIIARDQIATINGRLTQQRQTELGVRDFIWRTSQDERVRDEHAALEGRRFSWAQPPAIGMPGEPILCRCTAEPVLDEIAPSPGRL